MTYTEGATLPEMCLEFLKDNINFFDDDLKQVETTDDLILHVITCRDCDPFGCGCCSYKCSMEKINDISNP